MNRAQYLKSFVWAHSVSPAEIFDYTVSNSAELSAVMTTLNAGSLTNKRVGLYAGTYGELEITSLPSGTIIKSMTPHGAVFPRIKFGNALNLSIIDCYVQANDNTVSGYLVQHTGGNCGGFVLRGCRVRCGDSRNNAIQPFPDVDPTFHYPEYGTTGNWDDPGPDAIIGTGDDPTPTIVALNAGFGSNGWQGSLLIQDNDFTDLVHAVKFTVTGASSGIYIYGNRMGRLKDDFVGVTVYRTAPSAPQAFEVIGNEFFDHYSQPQDIGNPHGDMVQYAGDDQGSKFTQPLPGIVLAANVSWQRPGARGQPQRVFSSDVASGAPFFAPIVAQNLLISRITGKGVIFYAPDDNSGVYSAYIYQNTVLSTPANNTPFDNELLTNTVRNIKPSVATAAAIQTVNDPLFPSKSFIDGNIAESNIAQDWTTGALGNQFTGKATSATSYATWLDADASVWADMNTAEKTWAAFKPKVAYANFGAVRQTGTWAAHRDLWINPTTRPYTTFPAFAGVQDKQDTTTSTLITSAPAYCFAWGGRSISVQAGLEWRTTSDYAGTTIVQNWTTAPGSLQHGNFLWLRLTSSAGVAVTTAKTYTLDGIGFTWYVTTASANDWPAVALDGTAYWSKANSTALAAASEFGTLYMRFRHSATNPAASRTLYNGSGITLQVLTTGVVRLSHGGGRIDTSIDVCDGNWHDIMMSWDTSQADESLGRNCYIDGIARSNPAATWSGGAGVTTNYAQTGTPTFLGESTTTKRFVGDFEVFWFLPGARVDLPNATLRTRFYRENIGATGDTPTGSAPPVFITGIASQYGDVGGINWGTAAKYTKTAGNDPTDISGASWP